MKITSQLKALAVPALLLTFSSGIVAASDSPPATGSTPGSTSTPGTSAANSAAEHANSNSAHSLNRVQNGQSVIQGNLQTSQHIYYAGDSLDIRVQFARGAELLSKGAVDAHVVIFSQDGTVSSVAVPADVGATAHKFFSLKSIDTKTLPAGQYQLALVLTIPKGNPTLVSDWYSGFRAVLDTQAIYVSDVALKGDANHDGEWDNDTDGNGIADDEADTAALHVKLK